MKKILVIICAFISIVNMCTMSVLASSPIEPLWDNTQTVDAAIAFSGSTGTYAAFVAGDSDVTDIIAFAKLYYKDSRGGWVEIPMPWGFLTQRTNLYISETFTVESGVEYKVELEVTVYVDYDAEVINHTAYGTCP